MDAILCGWREAEEEQKLANTNLPLLKNWKAKCSIYFIKVYKTLRLNIEIERCSTKHVIEYWPS